MSTNEPRGRARGGVARAAKLSKQRRSEIARNAAKAKAELKALPEVTHGSPDHPLKIGDVEIPCYVLNDGTRVLSQSGMLGGLGMSKGTPRGGGDRLVSFVSGKAVSPYIDSDLSEHINHPIKFKINGTVVFGYPATILADICEAILTARADKALQTQQMHIAEKCEALVRGFARVGIIALVDEATGYQRDREKHALAKILEAFVANELQPYVRTFPADFYEELFRLRELDYPPEHAHYRPQYFGTLTNDIVYRRLAPAVLSELKRQAKKDEKSGKLFQRLTSDVGHPKLREHLASVIAIMKLSDKYEDFILKLNRIHPRYGDTLPLDLELPDLGTN